MTASSNLIYYPGITSTSLAAITINKTYWNSVISVLNSRFCTINIKDFYLNSRLKDIEYIYILFDLFPYKIIVLFKIDKLINNNGFIYIKVQGSMYSLR